jgi:hypothetical protein
VPQFGWRPNPAQVAAVAASLPHPAQLADAAPDWLDAGDGMTGDLLPYLAYYEIEAHNPDGSIWKAKGDEPPYNNQTGLNCTSEGGFSRPVDALQFMEIATGSADAEGKVPIFQRTAVEACYAFGLSIAGMRGDNGCDAASMAKAASTIGAVSYKMIGGSPTEDHTRLASFANNPGAVVSKYSATAAPFKVGKVVQIRTWQDYCAAIYNKAVVSVASDVGYEGSRDVKGIIRRRGSWLHNMMLWGVIRSDGTETAVQFQSWGKNTPTGPTVLKMPSFSFRVTQADAEAQFAAGDTWAFFLFPGFDRTPLPPQFVNNPFSGI